LIEFIETMVECDCWELKVSLGWYFAQFWPKRADACEEPSGAQAEVGQAVTAILGTKFMFIG
jgi:hypothetical protein